MTTPESYKPKSLRHIIKPPRPVMYAIGIERGEGNFGMTDGPTTNLEEMLEVVPDQGSVIIKFKDDTDQILYRWNDSLERWELQDDAQVKEK